MLINFVLRKVRQGYLQGKHRPNMDMEINCSTDDNNQMELPSVMALCRQIDHLV